MGKPLKPHMAGSSKLHHSDSQINIKKKEKEKEKERSRESVLTWTCDC